MPADAVEKPKPLPEGTYELQILGFKFDESGQKKTPFVEFTCGVMANVSADADELEKAGGTNKANGNPKELRLTFYITDDSKWRLAQFLKEHLGIGEMPMLEAIKEHSQGKRFIGQVEHSANDKDPEAPPYANIKKTAAI